MSISTTHPRHYLRMPKKVKAKAEPDFFSTKSTPSLMEALSGYLLNCFKRDMPHVPLDDMPPAGVANYLLNRFKKGEVPADVILVSAPSVAVELIIELANRGAISKKVGWPYLEFMVEKIKEEEKTPGSQKKFFEVPKV